MLTFETPTTVAEPYTDEANTDLDQLYKQISGKPLTLSHMEVREQWRSTVYSEGSLALQIAAATLNPASLEEVTSNVYLSRAESAAEQLKVQADKLTVVGGKASTRHDSTNMKIARSFVLEAGRVKARWAILRARHLDLLAALVERDQPDLADSLHSDAGACYAMVSQRRRVGQLAVDINSAQMRHEAMRGNYCTANTLLKLAELALKGINPNSAQYNESKSLLEQRTCLLNIPAAARESILTHP